MTHTVNPMRKIILLAALVSLVAGAQQDKEILISIPEDFSFPLGQQVLNDLAKQVYSGIPVRVSTEYFPDRQSALLIEQGKVHGEIYTSKEFYDSSGIEYISEPITTIRMAMFCLDRNECAFPDKNFIWIIPKGSGVASSYCLENKIFCVSVDNSTSAFVELLRNSGSILLMDKLSAGGVICNSEIDKIYYRDVPELDSLAFVSIGEGMSEYVTELETNIKKLKRDGTIDAAIQRFWQALYDCNISPINVDDRFLQLTEGLVDVGTQ